MNGDTATPVSHGEWDVFVSYCRSEAERAGAVVSALRHRGLRVFVDDAVVESFSSITATIATGLRRSKVLLAIYSYEYPYRRACQWELTYAYLSGQREGDARRRVVVVNPEAGVDHLQPLELRDARHWPWPRSAEAMDQLAAEVARHTAAVACSMGDTDTTSRSDDPGATPWLPAPARVGSPRFIDRFAEQWQIHSALHRHQAPLIHRSGQGAGRAAQLRGMPGIGKSLVAQEYALRFRSAFPGGVFWFDLHSTQGVSAWEAMELYAKQVAIVADALALDTPDDADLPQVLSRLALLLGERGSPCLWVVDGLPDNLTNEQLHLARGPHLHCSTLITTRSRHYTGFAESIDMTPLPDADSYSLLTSLRRPKDSLEEASAKALVHDVGGHPQALDLLASQAAASDFARLRNRLHEPGPDLLTLPSPQDNHPPLTASLLSRPLTGRTAPDDVLRLLALACPAPLSQSSMETALSSIPSYEPWEVSTLVAQALDSLLGSGALHPDPVRERAWTIHPLLARAVRRHDSDIARQEDLRRMLLQSLTAPPTTTPPTHLAVRGTADEVAPSPGPVERAAAFDLQVELVTRVGVQPLDEGAGSLREALTSLHTLFTTAREALHRVAGEATLPVRLPQVATELLNLHLRPFLTRWHTALQRHEAIRPQGVSVIAHEQEWEQSDKFRAELHALQAPLTKATEGLATICGISLLQTPQHGMN